MVPGILGSSVGSRGSPYDQGSLGVSMDLTGEGARGVAE